MGNGDMIESVLDDIRPLLEHLERKISGKYEKQIIELKKENERLNRIIHENKDYSYQLLNERYVQMVNTFTEQITSYKATILKLNSRISPKTNKTGLQQQYQQRQQPDIFSLIKPLKELPTKPVVAVKQEEESIIIESPHASSPVQNEGLSPTQYSSSQTGSEHVLTQRPNKIVAAMMEGPFQEPRNSYSIFHDNIDMDFDDDESESGYHDDDSPLSQRKRKTIEDSQKDYEELIPLVSKKKRIPLRDITNLEENNANKLDFKKGIKTYNLSRNFLKDRDWIIEDFKPNPNLIDANDGMYTKKRFGHQCGQDQNERCKCLNCMKFFEISGQPIELSRKDRFNSLIFKFHHRKNGDGNLFNFSMDAPGLNISEFPNSQEAKEYKLKLKRINKLKLLIRLINSMEVDEKGNTQSGLYVFKDDFFNNVVLERNFVIDDFVYDELELFLQDREAGLI